MHRVRARCILSVRGQHRVVWILPCLRGVFGNEVCCPCCFVKCSTYKTVKSKQSERKRKKIRHGWRCYGLLYEERRTCILQRCHHPPSWAGSLGLGEHLLSLSLRIICRDFKFHPPLSISTESQYMQMMVTCTLPGYLPPLFLLMKHTMRSTKMRRAMAHISPINQPWVAMSTCRLGAATNTGRGHKRKIETWAESSVKI